MDCKEIITEYLKQNGFDGLYHSDSDCACRIDDLFTCGCCIGECRAGYIQDYTRDGHDYIIGPNKPCGTMMPCPSCGSRRRFAKFGDRIVCKVPCVNCGSESPSD